MNDDVSRIERISTGVPGLDGLLEGGLVKGAVYIVQGSPGSGKTILGNQFCFHHAARGAKAVYVTLLAESHARMIAHLRRLTFFRPELVADRVFYLSAFKVLEEQGLSGLLKTVRDAVSARNADILVLDGLASAGESAPTDRDYKKFIHELQVVTAMNGATVLLLSSVHRQRGFYPEHTMVDGIIELDEAVSGLRSFRHLRLSKIRGTAQVRGVHTLEISDQGIVVRPRLETQLRRAPADAPARTSEERLELGVRELDRMLKGGLPGGSMTMLLGPSGCGKTILGLQFLAAGARRGQPGLFFGFFERPGALILKGDRIGLGVEALVRDKQLCFEWQPPIEGVLDSLGERLLQVIVDKKIKRLFIDGMQGFEIAADYPARVRDVFAVIAEELEQREVTTVFTLELRQLFGPDIDLPIDGVSAVTQNILLLRHVELEARMRRLISILKVRDSDYDSSIREFRITDNGIFIADTFAGAEQVLAGSPRAPNEPEPSGGTGR